MECSTPFSNGLFKTTSVVWCTPLVLVTFSSIGSSQLCVCSGRWGETGEGLAALVGNVFKHKILRLARGKGPGVWTTVCLCKICLEMHALGEGGVIGGSRSNISLSGCGEGSSLSCCGEGVSRRWKDTPPASLIDEVELNRTRWDSEEIGEEIGDGGRVSCDLGGVTIPLTYTERLCDDLVAQCSCSVFSCSHNRGGLFFLVKPLVVAFSGSAWRNIYYSIQ